MDKKIDNLTLSHAFDRMDSFYLCSALIPSLSEKPMGIWISATLGGWILKTTSDQYCVGGDWLGAREMFDRWLKPTPFGTKQGAVAYLNFLVGRSIDSLYIEEKTSQERWVDQHRDDSAR